MQSFLKALFLVFISEMGDKTQVVSFAFGARCGLSTVLAGVFIGIAAMMAVTVAVGDLISRFLPPFLLNATAGVLFIVFGAWALRQHEEADEKTSGTKFGPLAAVSITFIIAELGDKTVFASMAVAAQQHDYLPVWAGSVLGMYLADMIAILCGRIVGKRLPDKLLRYGSAAIFFIAGIVTLLHLGVPGAGAMHSIHRLGYFRY